MNLSMMTMFYLIFLLQGNKAIDNNYFEGSVTYRFDVISKNINIDSSLLKKVLGNGTTLFFKEGNYLHKYNGGLFKQDIYRKEDNKLYFSKIDNDTTLWYDCGSIGDSIINFSFTPKKEKILGIECDELIIYYKDKIVTDYYNSDSLKINSDWLRNYLLDGENLIDQKENSIYLKQKTEYSNFIIIETATGFSRESVDENIFKISPNRILIEQK